MAHLIDTHVHLWDSSALPPWLAEDPTLRSIAATRSITDYTSDAPSTLRAAVYMEVNVAPEHRDAEAASVLAMCADKSNLLCGAVIGAPVASGTVEEFEAYLSRWAVNPLVKGLREVLHDKPVGTCLREDVVAKARLCGEAGLVFELCLRTTDLIDAAELVARVPGTRFVVDHIGGHHQLTGQTVAEKEQWMQGLQQLAAQRNCWCKLSGLMGAQGGTEGASGSVDGWREAQTFSVATCLRIFATDRIVFGGDWPVSTLTAPISEWVDLVSVSLQALQPEAREQIMSGNAQEVYTLELDEAP